MMNKKTGVVFSFLLVLLISQFAHAEEIYSAGELNDSEIKLVLFHSLSCPHCQDERAWIENVIRPSYPKLVIEEYEVSENKELSEQYCREYNTTCNAVPRTFIAKKAFIGFDPGEGELVYNEGYKAYIGYSNQIRDMIPDSLYVNNSSQGEVNHSSPKLVLFYRSTCPHCHEEMEWLKNVIQPAYPHLIIEEYEASENRNLSDQYCREYNITCGNVPRTFVGGKAFLGFSRFEGELVYNDGTRTYTGYSNQIEAAILECIKETCGLTGQALAIDLSRSEPLVKDLLVKNESAISTASYCNGTYIVAWWTPARLSSNIGYPDAAVYFNATTMALLKSVVPSESIPCVYKPIQVPPPLLVAALIVIILYLLAFVFLRNRFKMDIRYWVAGLITLLIISGYIYFTSIPPGTIERDAKAFPFPVFVFIIALADGFNPCAFTVLAVLLSLLTHTNSRKKMALVGTVFILTSAFMYFLFILAINLFGSFMFSQMGDAIFIGLGILVLIAGIINLKDYFYFKKGISLTIPDSQRDKIFKSAGKIVRKVDKANDKRTLLVALLGTVVLATLVNIVELGCTAMLPLAYTSALFSNYGKEVGFYHIVFTLFYSFVYVIPLFVILADFLYTFKSDRVTEGQARLLKLVGGLMMIGLGAILIFNPGLLTMTR